MIRRLSHRNLRTVHNSVRCFAKSGWSCVSLLVAKTQGGSRGRGPGNPSFPLPLPIAATPSTLEHRQKFFVAFYKISRLNFAPIKVPYPARPQHWIRHSAISSLNYPGPTGRTHGRKDELTAGREDERSADEEEEEKNGAHDCEPLPSPYKFTHASS